MLTDTDTVNISQMSCGFQNVFLNYKVLNKVFLHHSKISLKPITSFPQHITAANYPMTRA